jgi:hypothetical protein
VTFNSSTATGNATGFNLESEVFAKGADTQANNCISWSNTDRGFYLGVQESLSLAGILYIFQIRPPITPSLAMLLMEITIPPTESKRRHLPMTIISSSPTL